VKGKNRGEGPILEKSENKALSGQDMIEKTSLR